ncbi:hypothetical protein SHJG_5501 [Streptomyces hygroscopicus subsp. jinggangensis 5008]|nr:hypothetical protein SHJG_5501 [Streptomyces hygroscopicus subsp. jinggangensis 5008]AGF64927.1 hypothetical protein SHJGH_5264 [Streptomyces hygroscopicus subsp. jinggangensis TL01]
MRWVILGALLGLLLAVPQALDLTGAVIAWLVDRPELLAFVLGAAARPYLPRMRRWTR